GDDLERALEDSLLQRWIAEALAFLEVFDTAFHEGTGVVVADLFSVEADLMDRADEVVQRLAGIRAQLRRDPQVVLEADAAAEARRAGELRLHAGVGAHRL